MKSFRASGSSPGMRIADSQMKYLKALVSLSHFSLCFWFFERSLLFSKIATHGALFDCRLLRHLPVFPRVVHHCNIVATVLLRDVSRTLSKNILLACHARCHVFQSDYT